MVKDEVMRSDSADSATKEHQVSMFAVLRARLASRRARNQRGTILVEALVMAAVGAFAMGGYLAITTGTQNTVRHNQSIDVVDQFATGQIEEMRSLPWSAVANCSVDPSNLGRTDDTADQWAASSGDVYHQTACPARYMPYYELATIAKVKIHVYTDVAWDPFVAPPTPTLNGRKKITLTLKWKPIGSNVERVRTVTAYRTSTPNEVPPVVLPTDGAPL
jgi:hypothetical protein